MYQSTPTYIYDPSVLAPDTPRQSLYDAAKRDVVYGRYSPLNNVREPVIATRAEKALKVYSWAARSVLQLPLATQECISRVDETIERIESTLTEYDDLVRDNHWEVGIAPTQALLQELQSGNLCQVDRIINLMTDLKSEHSMMLRAASKSFERTTQTAGSQALGEYLIDQQTNYPHIFDGMMQTVAHLSRCTDKIIDLEGLVEHRDGLGTLKQASKSLATLKATITDHYTYGDCETPRYKPKNRALPDFATDLDVGKFHSAVVSMVSQTQTEENAQPILLDAWHFWKLEQDVSKPRPTQIVNTLQSLHSEAQQADTENETSYIMTGLCQRVREYANSPSDLNTTFESGYTVEADNTVTATIPNDFTSDLLVSEDMSERSQSRG